MRELRTALCQYVPPPLRSPSSGSSESWKETFKFPTYETYFSCSNEFHNMGVKVRDVKAEDLKGLAKDLMGAVQVEGISTRIL